jgi:hypothetical protein
MELAGKNIVVYDCEIKNPVDNKTITWADKDKMGISVACLFDYRTMDYSVFMDDNMEELTKRLNDAELVSGFNIIGFDNPLVNATTKLQIRPDLPVYDILFHSRRSTGWDPLNKFPTGLKLDEHLKGTFGFEHKKTEDAAQAPEFWQTGQLGRLISYCLADVKREKMLFEHIWNGKQVTTPTHGSKELYNPQLALQDFQRLDQLRGKKPGEDVSPDDPLDMKWLD